MSQVLNPTNRPTGLKVDASGALVIATPAGTALPALGSASSAASLPVVIAPDQAPVSTKNAVVTASGNITAINSVPAGVASANSAIELTVGDANTLTVQVTGTYTGALTLQATVNGTNWVSLTGTPFFNVATSTVQATIASAAVGIFKAAISGFLKVRVTALAAVTGTATLSMTASVGQDLASAVSAIPVGTNSIGNIGTVSTITSVAAATPVTPTTASTNSAATTNATNTKNTAGTVWSIQASNINAAARFLKLYNKASAPTVGTDVPFLTVPLPPGLVTTVIGGANGIRFSTGISWALTAAAADSDTAAVAAGEHKVLINYT